MRGADFDALCEREQLQAVLAYVGSDQHLYTCGVNKAFRAHYHRKRSTAADAVKREKLSRCCNTSVEAVFASPSSLRMAVDHGFNLNSQDYAAEAGRYATIDTLEVVKQLGLVLNGDVCTGAARAGSLPTLRWLVEDQRVTLPANITESAAISGSVEVMQWLHQRGMSINQRAMSEATGSNTHTALVQYMLDIGTPLSDYAAIRAAYSADLKMLEWVSQHYAIQEWRPLTRIAAQQGNIEMLNWIVIEKGIAVDDVDLCRAAEAGQLAAMQWLIEHGCAVDLEVCQWAAHSGEVLRNTDALEWLRNHGHLILDAGLYCAIERLWFSSEEGHYAHVWKWLREVAECPWENCASAIAVEAARNCPQALVYVHEHSGGFSADELADQLEAACTASSYRAAEFYCSEVLRALTRCIRPENMLRSRTHQYGPCIATGLPGQRRMVSQEPSHAGAPDETGQLQRHPARSQCSGPHGSCMCARRCMQRQTIALSREASCRYMVSSAY